MNTRKNNGPYPQVSQWTIEDNEVSQHRNTIKSRGTNDDGSTTMYHISNTPVHVVWVGIRRSRSSCGVTKCCSSMGPCLKGTILGSLIAGIVLAVILTLHLTTYKAYTTTTSTTSTATTATTATTITTTTSTVSTSTTSTTTSTTASTTTTSTTSSATTTTTATTSTATTATTSTATTATTPTTTTATTPTTTTATTSTTTTATTSTATTATTSTTTTATTSTTTTATTSTTTSATTSTSATSTTTTTTTKPTTTPTCGSAPNVAGAIFRFDTSTMPLTYTLYTHTFIASASVETVSFIITGDSGPAHHYWLLDDVSVNDTANNANILINGNFDMGNFTGWMQYCNTDANCGTGFYGQLTTSSCRSISYCYMDRCNNGKHYDYLIQSFPTVVGNTYVLSFYMRAFANGGSHFAYVMLF